MLKEHEKKFADLKHAYTAYVQQTSALTPMDRVLKLIEVKARAEGYYTTYADKNPNKLRDAQDLWIKVQAELLTQRTLASTEFKQYRSEVKQKPERDKNMQTWTDGVSRTNVLFKAFIKDELPPELADLTSAERKAIRIYTDEAYKLINPSLSGDKKWIGNLNDEQQTFGKKVGTMANVGLLNMPPSPWKPGEVAYRGEALPLKEGKALGHKIKTKTFPFLLSTSELKAKTANFSQKNAEGSRGSRPVAMTYVISQWKSARNIAKLSVNPGERELLYPIGATFDVVNVISEKFTGSAPFLKEVELKER